MRLALEGLVPAAFTPLAPNGSLALDRVPLLVEALIADGVAGLYVCGSTGEGPSLTTEEREQVTESYIAAAAGRVPVLVQVGHNALPDACRLARHAQAAGAAAISATPPMYFKPSSLESLVRCLEEITAAASDVPFYYYHIPEMTNVAFDPVDLLRTSGARMPSFAGMKFTSADLAGFQACLELDDGEYDVFWGKDEMLLSALAVGARAAIGSTYNYAAPLYRKLMAAFSNGQLDEARQLQSQAVQMIRPLFAFGGLLPTLKAAMTIHGRDCGPPRLPHLPLTAEEFARLEEMLSASGAAIAG